MYNSSIFRDSGEKGYSFSKTGKVWELMEQGAGIGGKTYKRRKVIFISGSRELRTPTLVEPQYQNLLFQKAWFGIEQSDQRMPYKVIECTHCVR